MRIQKDGPTCDECKDAPSVVRFGGYHGGVTFYVCAPCLRAALQRWGGEVEELHAATQVDVRWRRDDVPDGVLTWGELLTQQPDLAVGRAIVAAGFLYEHRDGTTIQLVDDEGERHEVTRLHAEVERLTRERDGAREARAIPADLASGTSRADVEDVAALRAALEELGRRANAKVAEAAPEPAWRPWPPARKAPEPAPAAAPAPPAAPAAAHDARVRAEALRKAAETLRETAAKAKGRAVPPPDWRTLEWAADWLLRRAEAERIGGGR